MKFPTLYDPVKVIPSNSGNVYEVQYTQRYKADGTPYLEAQKTMRNNYKIAQSNKDICDYSALMKRYSATGDDSILNRGIKGSFGDFTDAPTDLVDAQNKILQARDAFYSLPADIRNEYDNNPMKFIADVGSEKFNKLVYGNNNPVEDTVIEKETKDAD